MRGEAGEAGVEDDAVGAALSLVVTWGPACWRGARRLQVRPDLAFMHLAPHGRKADAELRRPGGRGERIRRELLVVPAQVSAPRSTCLPPSPCERSPSKPLHF